MKAPFNIAKSLDGFIARSDADVERLSSGDSGGGSEDYGHMAFFFMAVGLVDPGGG